MAFSATTWWEVQTGGHDTNNGGGFDPSNANMATDLAATSATSSSPVVTSASYNFAARDVGHWVYIKSGTNWTPGWYQIASVAANAATLTAGVGTAITYSTLSPNTVAGCATTGSPTGGTWSIDYSQSTTPGIAYTDMVIDGATNTRYTSAGNPVGPNVVGNVIVVTSGSGFTTQRVQISSVSGTTATCDKSLGTLGSTGGNGGLGGALVSPGMASGLMIAGNSIWIKSGTYTIASASTNIATGCMSLLASTTASMSRVVGYGSLRGDQGTKPLLQASGISTFTIIQAANGNHLENLSLDGAGLTSSKGVSTSGFYSCVYKCKFANFTNNAVLGNAFTEVFMCEATGCSGTTAFAASNHYYCVARSNTAAGFAQNGATSAIGCMALNNTGVGTDGFLSSNGSIFIDCISYGNGRSGFGFNAAATRMQCVNCIAVNNTNIGYSINSVCDNAILYNCASYNNNGATSNISTYNLINFVTLTADPFADAAGNNFALNNHPGGGALLRGASRPGYGALDALPGISTLNYRNIGGITNPPPLPAGGPNV